LSPFLRDFWQEKVAWRENGDRTEKGEQVIRAGGRHYVVGPEDASEGLRGFDGRPFTFCLNGEGLVRSSNLWSQGLIPNEYADRLPDNAERVDS
ncbi:hypothetical protein BBK14_34100, partial [Parafrankia soli]